MILPIRILCDSSNKFLRCIHKGVVFSIPPVSKSVPALSTTLPNFDHPISCFCTTTAHQRWKFVQSNKVINNGRPGSILSPSVLPSSHISERFFTEDTETTALTVWQNLKELKTSPFPALVLGFTGLAPFLSVPVYMMMTGQYFPQLTFFQLAYGAVTLSFVGGVRWGFAISKKNSDYLNWFNLGYSVTPALIAWIGLLLPDPFSLFLVMSGLAGSAYFDTALRGYPPWYKGLRFVLSIAAILSMWTVFTCKLIMTSKYEMDIDEEQ